MKQLEDLRHQYSFIFNNDGILCVRIEFFVISPTSSATLCLVREQVFQPPLVSFLRKKYAPQFVAIGNSSSCYRKQCILGIAHFGPDSIRIVISFPISLIVGICFRSDQNY